MLIESRAPQAKEATPITSATPAATTNGVVRFGMRRVPRTARGSTMTTIPTSRAGRTSHANSTSPLTWPTA